MPTSKRRRLADYAESMMPPAASSSADAPPAVIGSEPAPQPDAASRFAWEPGDVVVIKAADVPEPQPDAATASPASSSSAAPAAVDDDGPRLRAEGEAATLKNGNVRRTVYVGADDWRAVLRLAMRQGVTASDVTRAALRDYLRRQARR